MGEGDATGVRPAAGAAGAAAPERAVVNSLGRALTLSAPLPGRAEAFPHRGDPAFLSARGWVAAKGEHDMGGEAALSKLWRIHGSYYDLSEFKHEHPGGAEFLDNVAGTDATVAFEAHHIKHTREQLLSMVAAYKVDLALPEHAELKAAAGRAGARFEQPFTFAEGGFYDVCKRRVREHLRRVGSPSGEPSAEMYGVLLAVNLQWLAVALLAARTGRKSLAVLAGALLLGVWGSGHEAFHQGKKDKRLSLFRYCIGLTGFCHHEQMVTHSLSHHLLPNTFLDWEVFAWLPVGVGWLTSEKLQTVKPMAQWRLWPAAFSFGTFAGNLARALPGAVRRPSELTTLGVLALFCALGGPRRGLRQWLIMNLTFGLYFPLLGLMVHHSYDERQEPVAWHEGEPGAESDFGLHQVISTSDHSPDLSLYSSLMLTAMLNTHTSHHLFPTVSHSHHRAITRDIIAPTLLEFGHKYRAHSALDLAKGFIRMLETRRYKPLDHPQDAKL